MATSSARGGRRRWMLHEDVRSGVAAIEEESLADEQGDGSARRYSFDGNSVSFAVASHLLPQRLLSLWGLLVAGIALVAGLTLLDVRSAEVCQSLGIAELPAADLSSAASFGSWLSNACLWMATLLCLLTYGLRRHRLDDYRGSYRRWLGAAAACGVANLLLSTGLHHPVAEALAAASGFTALPGHAVWWLAPAAIMGAWVVVRVALDMRPCRLGLFFLFFACALYLTSLAASFGAMPVSVGSFLSGPVALCAGHLFLAVALLAQVRFILLEATGQIAPARAVGSQLELTNSTQPKAGRVSGKLASDASAATATAGSSSQKKQASNQPAKQSLVAATNDETEWVDGRDTRDSDWDEAGERRLSKAERKRLRKAQARNRAA